MTDTIPAHGGPDYNERGMGDLNGKPSLTTAQAAIQLDRAGFHWGGGDLGSPATVTYSFAATAPDSAAATGVTGFHPLDAAQIAAAERALQVWSDAANITFVRIGSGTEGAGAYSNDGQIVYGGADALNSNETGVTARPVNSDDRPTYVYVRTAGLTDDNWSVGQRGQQTFTHETGHAIGLSHPGFYNATDSSPPTYANDALYAEDTRQFSIMSYFTAPTLGASFTAQPSAPMLDDIAAAQRLYGANYETRDDDTVYGFGSNSGRDYLSLTNASSHITASIWDGGGTDTLNFSLYSMNQLIDLRQGNFSNVGGDIGNVSIALGAVIENADGGAGNDIVEGTIYGNGLYGGGGNDTIYGNGGSDHLQGNAGDDVLWIGSSTGAITASNGSEVFGGQGNDTIHGGSAGQEQLSGDLGDDAIYAGSGASFVSGGIGNDMILAGDGNNHVWGNASGSPQGMADGNDTIMLGAGTNYVNGNAGNDVISAGTSGSTGANHILGGADNDLVTIVGAGRNSANGNMGADTIDASAATGDNLLRGGQGNDLVRVGQGHDQALGDLGSDTLVAGSGANHVTLMTGGSDGSADLFVFHGIQGSAAVNGMTYYQEVTDYAHGTDHLALSFQPGSVYSDGTTYGDVGSAQAAAQNWLNGHTGSNVVAEQIGSDTYLFYNATGTATNIDSIVKLDHVGAAGLGTSDFVTAAG